MRDETLNVKADGNTHAEDLALSQLSVASSLSNVSSWLFLQTGTRLRFLHVLCPLTVPNHSLPQPCLPRSVSQTARAPYRAPHYEQWTTERMFSCWIRVSPTPFGELPFPNYKYFCFLRWGIWGSEAIFHWTLSSTRHFCLQNCHSLRAFCFLHHSIYTLKTGMGENTQTNPPPPATTPLSKSQNHILTFAVEKWGVTDAPVPGLCIIYCTTPLTHYWLIG